MADVVINEATQVLGSTNQGRSSRANARGEQYVVDWVQAAIDEGKAFAVTVGAFSTPITGGGNGDVADADQPELVISVPSGKTIWLYRLSVACLVPLLATDEDEAEIFAIFDKDSAWDGTGTATTETPINLRTNHASASDLTVRSAFTANITTAIVEDIRLAHEILLGDVQGTAATALWTRLKLDYEPLRIPRMVGPCCVAVYWGGTVAVDGFAVAEWVERDTYNV